MPNWVCNKITFIGGDHAKVIEALKSEGRNMDGGGKPCAVDFNRLVPIPECVEGVEDSVYAREGLAIRRFFRGGYAEPDPETRRIGLLVRKKVAGIKSPDARAKAVQKIIPPALTPGDAWAMCEASAPEPRGVTGNMISSVCERVRRGARGAAWEMCEASRRAEAAHKGSGCYGET